MIYIIAAIVAALIIGGLSGSWIRGLIIKETKGFFTEIKTLFAELKNEIHILRQDVSSSKAKAKV